LPRLTTRIATDLNLIVISLQPSVFRRNYIRTPDSYKCENWSNHFYGL